MNVYFNSNLANLLVDNTYPGRGIIMGRTPDGRKMVSAYFIMGRSGNSRNRVFLKTEDGIRTQAADPKKLEDPSLIIYHPVRKVGTALVVTNGDQTDTIMEALEQGGCFESALLTREFEPDAPNFTPRISAILYPDGTYKMAILKSADQAGSACTRQFFCYPPIAGTGHFLHTYNCDGEPLPTFTGEPRRVEIPNDIDELVQMTWDALHGDNKISLYVRYVDLDSGAEEVRLVNKHRVGGKG